MLLLLQHCRQAQAVGDVNVKVKVLKNEIKERPETSLCSHTVLPAARVVFRKLVLLSPGGWRTIIESWLGSFLWLFLVDGSNVMMLMYRSSRLPGILSIQYPKFARALRTAPNTSASVICLVFQATV